MSQCVRTEKFRRKSSDEEDVHILQLLAGLAGMAIGRSAEHKMRLELMARLEDATRQLEQLATTDGLTGMSDRQAFDTALRDRFEQEKRRNGLISLVMIDIDHFKQYNDAFGHPAGDLLLKSVAETIRRETSSHEVVARYGGEEFAIILPGADAVAVLALAERLRNAVEVFAGGLRPVTISLGTATAGPETGSPEMLLKQADAALYQSKANGRNRATQFLDLKLANHDDSMMRINQE